jgi:hypothetical protein
MTKLSVIFRIVTNKKIINVMDYLDLTKWPDLLTNSIL